VQINYTDMTKIGSALDTTKDVPLKKPQSAYVLFGNEVSKPATGIHTCVQTDLYCDTVFPCFD